MITPFFSDIPATSEQIQILNKYLELLKNWNEKINLVSFKNDEEVIIKHFLDSAWLINFVNFKPGEKVMDIGTGGGLPGIILAILKPATQFTLVDSVAKKMRAVADMVEKLNLKNVTCLTDRAEVLAKKSKFKENFDYVLSRAVATLPTLLEYAAPFLKINGQAVFYKSGKIDLELEESHNALAILKFDLENVFSYQLAKNQGDRRILCFKKEAKTPVMFPRETGLAKKKPLG